MADPCYGVVVKWGRIVFYIGFIEF
jgi:hypothetical protein